MRRDLHSENDQCAEPSAPEIARVYIEYDYMDLDFHLTPNGWVMGDIRCVFRDVNLIKPAPIDPSTHLDAQDASGLDSFKPTALSDSLMERRGDR